MVGDIKPSRKAAAEEIAKAIVDGIIDYSGLQDKKSEVTKRLGCETPSNDEIFKIVEEIDKNALKRFLESKEGAKIRKRKKEIQEIICKRPPAQKIYPPLVFITLLLYYGYFINIDFFFDWDTLAVAISMKEGTFNLIRSFSSYHMLASPLAYLCAILSSPFVGWKPLVGWKILVSLCAAGTGTMLFITVHKLTRNYVYALVSTAFLAVTYGYLFLTLSLEDNIINTFFNMVFIFFLLAQIGEIEFQSMTVKGINILSLLTGASLGLAIATHIHSMLFIPLILAVAYFKREDGLFANVKEILMVMVGSIVVVSPFIAINAYAYNWTSFHDLINYFTIGYHKDPNLYYFANPNRNIWEQLELVNGGLTSLFFQRYPDLMRTMPNFLIYSKFLLLILAGVLGGFALSSIKTKTTQIMLCMLILMIPHSLFYESWNAERWVDILLPLAVILGNSLKIERGRSENELYTKINDFYAEHGLKVAIAIVIFLFIFSLSSFNSLSHFQKNPVHKLADEIDGATENDALVVMDIRSTSELGLYVNYAVDRELLFLSDRTLSEIGQEIDLRVSMGKPIYISTIALSTLIQSNPELKTEYSYELVVDNRYYSLYRISK